MKNNKIPKIKSTAVDKSYKNLLQEVKGILDKGTYISQKIVDNIKVQTYWQVGERITREELNHKDRAGYGKYLVENLAKDLNVGTSLLYEIVKFYNTYPILHAVRGELNWTHYRELIKIVHNKKRAFYEYKTIQNAWGYRGLHKQIKANLYENTSPKEIKATFQVKLPPVQTTEIFKDTYNFDFLQLQAPKEKVVEDLIVNNIENFLAELGQDFFFGGRQIPIKIDQETHYIDLILLNAAIPCKIIVDLKADKITSQDIGQMNKYVNFYRENRQYVHEKDAIGLIIGQEAGADEIYYALGGLEEKFFVAVYKAKLPSAKKIKEAVKRLA